MEYIIGLGEAMKDGLIRYPVKKEDFKNVGTFHNPRYQLQGFGIAGLEMGCLLAYPDRSLCRYAWKVEPIRNCTGCAIPTLVKDLLDE